MPTDVLVHKEIFEEYLSRGNYNLSPFSFVNLCIWQDFFKFEMEVIEDNFCVFARADQVCFLYLPPLGAPMRPSVIDEVFRRMEKENGARAVTRIENVLEEDLKFFPPEKFSLFKKNAEYGYTKEDLARLKGRPYKSKRNARNHFIKNYQYRYLSYKKEMAAECLGLYNEWAKNRKESYSDPVFRQMIDDNEPVLRRTLEFYEELALVGRIVRIDNKLEGFTFGYPMNPDVFCILYEVTNLSFKGLSSFIFSEFCRDPQLKSYRYINAMDDFGMDNIALTKRSFHPSVLWGSYVVSKK